MAENAPPSGLASLPPPPTNTVGAPGQQPYDNNSVNGQLNSHMPPPPLPPVVIPHNNNPIPTAMTSPMSGDILSPTSTGGFVRRAAPEPNKRALYVGGLDPRVTEEVLKQIFETTGHVQSVKIIPDKNVSSDSLGSFHRKQNTDFPPNTPFRLLARDLLAHSVHYIESDCFAQTPVRKEFPRS